MSVLNKVTHYKKKIERNKEHTETLIHCINRLHELPITVRHLEKTGIGKTINGLRRFQGDVGNAVKALIWKWKRVLFIETAAEEHIKKERDLKNPIVNNSDEIVLNAVTTEEKEVPTHIKEDTNTLRSTDGNCGSEILQEVYGKGHISSIANLKCNDSEYSDGLRCDTLHQSTKGEDKVHLPKESFSHVFAMNQSSPKTDKQKHSHRRHSSKHHTRNRRDKSKHNNGKRADSKLKIKEDSIKIKLKKVHTKNENRQEGRTLFSSGSCCVHNHCSKQAENETKYCRKERGQKRKTAVSERSENLPKRSKCSEKVKDKIAYDDSIDDFAEALRMGDTMGNKRSSSTTTSMMRNSYSKNSPGTKTTNISCNSTPEIVPTTPYRFLTDIKFESLHVETDLVTMLSDVSPDYNALSHLPPAVETTALKHAAKEIPLSKRRRQRMKVYSGVKTARPIPTLYDLTVRVLQEHIDALEYTGGVPYDILKPILKQATPEQLFQVEYYNPYLIKDTNELWEFHCRKEFRSGQLQPMETAREMYLRCLDEREAKLKALTCSIQQSLAKTPPIRKTKLAYVDSDPKPPRTVAKEQAKYGTGSILKSDGREPQRNASTLMPLTSTAKLSFLKKSTNSTDRTKPQLAPLMQKTMKLVKSFRR